MMENEHSSLTTKLYDVPNSMIFSIEQSEKNQNNLLQVIVENQTVVFDLTEEYPKEVFFFNATNQFMDPERYAESGI